MARAFGLAFGVATQALFVCTVPVLYLFLAGRYPPSYVGAGADRAGAGSVAAAIAVDVLLALAYAVPHSALLYPSVRKRLTRWIPAPFYGCFFCVATCVSLLMTIALWQPTGTIVWRCNGVAANVVDSLFYASWAALFYSLYLAGLGYQTGLTPWWGWVRRRPPAPRPFNERSLYQLLRHPVYLSFLGLIWFAPTVTADRAALIGVWTVYIFVGSWLKDRRLVFFLGDTYRDYMARVPGYPLMPAGPLARVGRISPPTNPRDGESIDGDSIGTGRATVRFPQQPPARRRAA